MTSSTLHSMDRSSIRYIDTVLLATVVAQIRELEQEFRDNKALLLTEDDVQSHLFCRLKSCYPDYLDTMNRGVKSISIHSEVKFYDRNGKLTLIPDLCIIPPGELSIYASVLYGTTPRTKLRRNRLPSKQFEFSGDSLAIELKYCRKKGGINAKDIAQFQKDFDKLRGLRDLRHERTEGRNHLLGVLAIFNKTDKGRGLVEAFIQHNAHEHIQILYCTGGVDFGNFKNEGDFSPPDASIGRAFVASGDVHSPTE